MSSLIIRRARLVPVHAGDVVPDAPVDVLVTDGTVAAVAPRLDRPAGAPEVDAEGRWVIPGLWDQHVHLAQWTLSSGRLDLAGARSPEAALAMVAERVAEYPDLPVIGWGHRSAGWDRDATVSELDAVSVADARAKAYEGVASISFPGAQWRRDIAAEPLGVVEGAAALD